jgi:hypothetical protein
MALVQIGLTEMFPGFPMDVCQQHYDAARAFFGPAAVRVLERYPA